MLLPRTPHIYFPSIHIRISKIYIYIVLDYIRNIYATYIVYKMYRKHLMNNAKMPYIIHNKFIQTICFNYCFRLFDPTFKLYMTNVKKRQCAVNSLYN